MCPIYLLSCGAERAGLMNKLKKLPVPVFCYFGLLDST